MQKLRATPENLARLFYIYAYSRGKFVLSSGKVSSYYLNGKEVILSARGLYLSTRLLLERIFASPPRPEAVGGLSFGAAPLAAAVSAFSCFPEYRSFLSSFIVRKEAKAHGTRSRVEGPFYRGIQAVVVDDVLTTGASVLSAARAVEEAGGRVDRIYVLVDRREGGGETVERAGYRLESLFTRRDLERLDRRLRQKYPVFCNGLGREPVAWDNLIEGCREIAGHHPRLGAALKEKIAALRERHGLLPGLPVALSSSLLKPLKIVEFELDPSLAGEMACRALEREFSVDVGS